MSFSGQEYLCLPPPWGCMIPFEGNRKKPLLLGQGGLVHMRRHQFRSHWVGDGGRPPQLVLVVLVAAAVAATTVAIFSYSTCGRVGDTCSASVRCFCSGERFSYFPQMRPLRPSCCSIWLILTLRRHPRLYFRFACFWAVASLFAWRSSRFACSQTRVSRSLGPQYGPWSLWFWCMTSVQSWNVGSTRFFLLST